jgi:pyruvate dehydrogenase E2 component (dihydrolipoamide acetyltransferase)
MAIEITVPRLGWQMEEALFTEWLKQAGEEIRAGDLLYALDTDKVTQEVESLDGGTLHIPPDAPQPGDLVVVGQRLGWLLRPGETVPTESVHVNEVVASPGPVVREAVEKGHARSGQVTPRARRVARELGVDVTSIPGSGRGGRVREADVRAAHIPAPTMRRGVAQWLLMGRQKTVPVTLHSTADATVLVRLRGQLKGAAVVPTYNDLLVKLAAAALNQHPLLNARWEGEQLVSCSAVDMGIAVDTDAGVIVPVLRNVASLSVTQVAERARDLAARARSRRLRAEELEGGTFTVTNLGSLGVDAFTPVIHYPECAILGVGRIVRQPVAVGDAIGLRDVLTLSLTFDHCAFDGAPAARFLQTLVRLIEAPPDLS